MTLINFNRQENALSVNRDLGPKPYFIISIAVFINTTALGSVGK